MVTFFVILVSVSIMDWCYLLGGFVLFFCLSGSASVIFDMVGSKIGSSGWS